MNTMKAKKKNQASVRICFPLLAVCHLFYLDVFVATTPDILLLLAGNNIGLCGGNQAQVSAHQVDRLLNRQSCTSASQPGAQMLGVLSSNTAHCFELSDSARQITACEKERKTKTHTRKKTIKSQMVKHNKR